VLLDLRAIMLDNLSRGFAALRIDSPKSLGSPSGVFASGPVAGGGMGCASFGARLAGFGAFDAGWLSAV
jgi:hypothetical protein